VVARYYNPNTQEADVGGSQVLGSIRIPYPDKKRKDYLEDSE
jgi:hypothetical protein